MIYNTRNRSDDTTEGQKEKITILMPIFSTVSQKSQLNTRLNKMWSLKSLAMLKCKCRTSLNAIQQYK